MKVDTIITLDGNIATLTRINNGGKKFRCDQIKIARNVPHVKSEKIYVFSERVFAKPKQNGRKRILNVYPFIDNCPRKR